ncbi:MAG: SDR family oxidoreductase [Myxococcota bacterium]
MTDTTFLITGANRGIGLAFARALQQRNATVIGACRQSSPELDALGVRVETLDVTSDASVAALAERLQHTSIDVLINNAGVLNHDALGTLNFDSLRTQFEVNSLGPLRVTQGLLPRLAPKAKVIIITSRMGSISDNSSGGAYGYRMSKAAVNAAGKSLALDLKSKAHPVALLHPGWVQTEMTGGTGHVTADESVAGLLRCIEAVNIDNSGSFFHANGERLSW